MYDRPVDIEKVARDVAAMTEWSPVPSGSILRVPAYSYENWGIRVTPENIRWLSRASADAYMVEWARTDDRLNALVARASEKADLGDVNALMNAQIGKFVAEEIARTSPYKGPFTLVDIGAGTGATSIPAFNELGAMGYRARDSDSLILIEPSAERMDIAVRSLASLPFWKGRERGIVPMIGREVEMLTHLHDGSVGLAVSNAAIHHNAFNYHLEAIQRVLEPGGTFINGDWNDSISHSPAKAYWMFRILSSLGDEETTGKIFDWINGTKPPNDLPESLNNRRYVNSGTILHYILWMC